MSSLQDVEKEIQDCKDMDNWAQQCQVTILLSFFHCFVRLPFLFQVILKANSGMDLPEYGRLLCLIALNRLSFRNETALKTLKPLSESKQLLEETGRLMIADCICQNCWEMCNSCSSWLNSCDILAIKNELEFLQQSQYHQLLDSELIIHTLKDLNEVF